MTIKSSGNICKLNGKTTQGINVLHATQKPKTQQQINQHIKKCNPTHTFGFSALGGSQTQNQGQSNNQIRSLLHYSSSASDSHKGGEISLWRAVIAQAVIDAVSNCKRKDRQLAKKSAIEWFSINNENFLTVCNFAKMSPQDVLAKSLYAIQSANSWKRNTEEEKIRSANKLKQRSTQNFKQNSKQSSKQNQSKNPKFSKDDELYAYYQDCWM